MTDLQLYLAVGLPTIAVLASLTVSLITTSGIRSDLRAETVARRAEFAEERATRRAEFAEERAPRRADMEVIRGDMQEIRADMKEIRAALSTLTSIVYERMGLK